MGPGNPKTAEGRLKALIDKFVELDLKVRLFVEIDGALRLKVGYSDIMLDEAVQDLAFDLAAKEISPRMATLFAAELVKQIDASLESGGADGGYNPGPRAAGSGSAGAGEGSGAGNRAGGTEKATGIGVGGGAGRRRRARRRGGEADEPEGPPLSEEEVRDHLASFVSANVGAFQFDDDEIERLASAVKEKGQKVRDDLGITEDELLKLAYISLYEIVFLCDDSGSMRIEKRLPALVETLQSVTAWATALQPRGVSMRFLNYAHDNNGEFDGLVDGTKIADAVYKVKLGRFTKLGTMLEEKILQYRAQPPTPGSGPVRGRPLIAVIITDGEPTHEPPTRFRDAVLRCKAAFEQAGAGGGVVFIIFPVGGSSEALDFIDTVTGDDELEGLVYGSSESVDDVIAGIEDSLAQDDEAEDEKGREYGAYLLREFITALRSQTK